MALPSESFDATLASLGISPPWLRQRLDQHLSIDTPRFRRMWMYYRNPSRPMPDDAARPYALAQEWGLPRRIVGSDDAPRREVVVENDIAWRLDAMVDFLFGRPFVLNSTATDQARREQITQLLRAILSQHGGLGFCQQLALVGAVYGHVDVLIKLNRLPEPAPSDGRRSEPGASHPSPEAIDCLARCIRLEAVEPARALPIFRGDDPSVLLAWAQVYTVPADSPVAPQRNWLTRLLSGDRRSDDIAVVDLLLPDRWLRFHDEKVVASGTNGLGQIPLAHIQNVAVPFCWNGAGDVEPLMPLQDELNTRLSDRAHRITLQSFRMYLGKGIDHFTDQPVAPGRMWMTENPDAQIVEFGGDAACPSEDAHIRELREAMDKASGVSPIAAGAIKGRIGRLTSAAALRVTLLALLARTERKRATYGAGLARVCELALAWLDRAGLFPTTPDERHIEIHWPNPIPLNEIERLDEARGKLAVGVPRQTVLRELGYEPSTETEH